MSLPRRRLHDELLGLATMLALLAWGYGVFALDLGSALFWLALAGWLGTLAASALVVLRESRFGPSGPRSLPPAS